MVPAYQERRMWGRKAVTDREVLNYWNSFFLRGGKKNMECRISVDNYGLFFISLLHLLQKLKVLSKSDIKVKEEGVSCI